MRENLENIVNGRDNVETIVFKTQAKKRAARNAYFAETDEALDILEHWQDSKVHVDCIFTFGEYEPMEPVKIKRYRYESINPLEFILGGILFMSVVIAALLGIIALA